MNNCNVMPDYRKIKWLYGDYVKKKFKNRTDAVRNLQIFELSMHLNHIQFVLNRAVLKRRSLRLFFWKIGIFKLPGNKESGYFYL